MSRGGKRRRKGPRIGRILPNNRKLKRAHPYTDLSERVCVIDGCRARIKVRMVIIRDADICYRHWQTAERSRREVRA